MGGGGGGQISHDNHQVFFIRLFLIFAPVYLLALSKIRVHTVTRAHSHGHTRTRIYSHTHTYTHMQSHAHSHTRTQTHARINACTCAHAHARRHLTSPTPLFYYVLMPRSQFNLLISNKLSRNDFNPSCDFPIDFTSHTANGI